MFPANLVGGKAAQLAELTSLGLPVPRAMCVTTTAYRTYLLENQLDNWLNRALHGVVPGDYAGIVAVSRAIRERLAMAPVPAHIAEEILEGYLGIHRIDSIEPGPVAVRSSANDEDGRVASFAGQCETKLNVHGGEAMAPYTLLQGLPNKTVEAAHALWKLSRKARASSAVRSALTSEDPDALFGELEKSAEGREFTGQFHAFLDEYGWRGDLWALDYPTWVEDQRTPLKTLRSYANQLDDASPAAEHARLAEKREQALAAVRARLAGAPPEARGQFERLLQLAQFATVLSEDHNCYIDQTLLHLTRRALTRAGERLARRGQLDDALDVLMLTGSEVVEALSSDNRPGLKPTVAERRTEFARFRAITPPPFLGTPPPPPPPDVEPSPMEKAMGLFFGGPPRESTQTEVRGNAGSRGTVTGIARVVLSLDEASALQTGEILVCPTTAPPWTPLFAVARAVVTDTGGALSHCAVVAREFGIPAVVGTHVATSVIKTGQRITVDGGAGIVILDPS